MTLRDELDLVAKRDGANQLTTIEESDSEKRSGEILPRTFSLFLIGPGESLAPRGAPMDESRQTGDMLFELEESRIESFLKPIV